MIKFKKGLWNVHLLCSKAVRSCLPYYQEHSRVMSACQSLLHPCYQLFLCGSLNQAPIYNRSCWIWWFLLFKAWKKDKNWQSVQMRNDNLWSCLIRKYVINCLGILQHNQNYSLWHFWRDNYMYALCGSLKSRSTGMFGEQIRNKPIVVVNVSFNRYFWYRYFLLAYTTKKNYLLNWSLMLTWKICRPKGFCGSDVY